jgi:tetratricopeptide (TPR) repeat protein
MAEELPQSARPAPPSPAAQADARAAIGRAASAYGAGDFVQAERLCRRALDGDPSAFDAFHLLGAALVQLGRPEDALRAWDGARAIQPQHVEVLKNYGVVLGRLGRFGDALQIYDEIVALAPGYADAFYNRGIALGSLGRLGEALASYDRAIALAPGDANAFYNRGNVLQRLRRLEEALASYRRVLALHPGHVEALNNAGVTLRAMARLEEALASYDAALAIWPDYAEALNNRGIVLADLGRCEEALASYERAIALRPDAADAYHNRATALRKLNRLAAALASYDAALALRPDYPEALVNRGVTLAELDRHEEALASYDRAIALRPGDADANYNRGGALRELNRPDDAVASYARALTLKPDYPEARFGLCMAELPILYRDEAEILSRRQAYARALQALSDGDGPARDPAHFARGVGSHQPFYLPYQGRADRCLQGLYGSFVSKIIAARYPQAVLPPPPAQGERVRVGMVSGFFRRHSNWKLPIKGWLSQLDRRQFEIFGYHTGFRQDANTAAAAALCARFVQGPLTPERWRDEILADAPHVLIYPEIGMDPVVITLAAQRLARVQCTSWGQPETSGLPTIDYFLSSDLMEPPQAQDHYTERLVRLPNLSIHVEPGEPSRVRADRARFGLRPSATVYWCGQSLYKYLPQFDDVFARIAGGAGDCQFAFIEHPHGASVTDLFRQRLRQAFEAVGLRAEAHCVFLPVLDEPDYGAAMGQCDVFLDSIGWSGCNSTLESLPYDLPIVTFAGSLMRARHGVAILTGMGVTATITDTIEDYVACAVRLARDLPWRMAMKAAIAAGKARIYGDRSCIAALEGFLDRVGRGLTG